MGKEGYELTKSNKARLDALLDGILKEVKPSKKEEENTKRAINIIMERLKVATPKSVEILLAGSVARGTQISGNFDIDIFLLFPKSMDEKAMEKKGLEIAKGIVMNKGESYSVKYAEHPYARLSFSELGVEAEIIPGYKIANASERATAVDRTQLHNEFVNSRLGTKQRDDVRLLKTFLHSYNVYGAEARIEGFSGYLCELLIYHFGSFANFVQALADLKLPVAIDVSKHKTFTRGTQELGTLTHRFGHRFVVLDPTDSGRNVAANLSEESLGRTIIAARNLIAKPSKRSFYGEGFSDAMSGDKISRIRNTLGADLYAISFGLPDIAEDITWQQLKRLRTRLSVLLGWQGFAPLLELQSIVDKQAVIAFFVNPASKRSGVIDGPTVLAPDAYKGFMKAHSGAKFVSLRGNIVYAIEQARYRNPEELLRKFLSNPKEKLPSYLSRKGARFYVNSVPEPMAKMLYRSYMEKRISAGS